jgi:integrase/recombinase XerC
MTNTGGDMRTMTLEKGLAKFIDSLAGKNRSGATVRAYSTDISQFIAFLHENNVSIHIPAEVEKIDVVEYLSTLAKKELTGIARARKMSAIREYFRFLEGVGVISKSPTTGIETPKREKNSRQYLRSDEYTKMLSLAGANPRDYAILQVFLQTGIRVSELTNLRIADIDFIKPSITVRGKGSVEREIALEKKGVHALKSYLVLRPDSISHRVFLNYQGEPISERGIRKLVVKYRKEAGITKKASWGIRLTRDTLSHQSLIARACWRCRGRGKSSMCNNTLSKRSGNPRLKNREAGVVPSEARQSKLCSAVHTG